MRKKAFTLFTSLTFFSLLLLPLAVDAHGAGMMDFGQSYTASRTMRDIEDRALGSELHEEMESLMAKMMSGSLTEEETGRITEIMNQYPGPSAMMMNRFGGAMGTGSSAGWGMMSFGGMNAFGFWYWISTLVVVVWLAVGILLIVWLWKKINKK